MVRPHHTGLVFHEFLQNGRHIRSEICIFVLGITKLRANQTLKYDRLAFVNHSKMAGISGQRSAFSFLK